MCAYEAQGENFGEWMNAMKPHYAEMHADVMKANMGLSDEQKQTEMMKWMDANKARFDAMK